MMKQLLLGAMALFAPIVVSAQVEKQVEVTKAYEPTIEQATKLSISPDRTDTTHMRPEIDYTITPLALETSLKTRPINPAQLTYWEFNRPRPYYLRAGVGYPWQSVADFYVATQQPSIGYALAYFNHKGRYGDIKNDYGLKRDATRIDNRIGGAAGRYVGPRAVEFEVDYRHHQTRRYGMALPAELAIVGRKVGYSDLSASLRFGDDFQHLERINYAVWLQGDLFFDSRDLLDGAAQGRENSWSVGGKVAHSFSGHEVAVDAAYYRQAGVDYLEGHGQHQYKLGGRYGKRSEKYNLEAGVDYYFDHFKQGEQLISENYLFPFLRFDFDLFSDAVKPFVEVDGSLDRNDLQRLMEANPYLALNTWLPRSTVTWEGRAGITGNSKNNLFAYRAYVDFGLSDNQCYWLLPANEITNPHTTSAGYMIPYLGRQSRLSLAGELTYRPHLSWTIDGAVRFTTYTDDDTLIKNGQPAVEGHLAVRYASRKIRFGVKAELMSARTWSYVNTEVLLHPAADKELFVGSYKAPATVNLSADFEWMISGSIALFAEADNLFCSKLYRYPTMPEYGANCMLGVRLAF